MISILLVLNFHLKLLLSIKVTLIWIFLIPSSFFIFNWWCMKRLIIVGRRIKVNLSFFRLIPSTIILQRLLINLNWFIDHFLFEWHHSDFLILFFMFNIYLKLLIINALRWSVDFFKFPLSWLFIAVFWIIFINISFKSFTMIILILVNSCV